MTDKRKKNKWGFRITVLMLCVLTALSGLAYAAEDTETESTAAEAVECKSGVLVTPIGDPEAEAPELKADSAALYSLDMDRMVYGKNVDERISPYSTTKLLTCWLALENLSPDDVVTVSEQATQEYENGTTIWLKPGEQLTIRDLMYGAMLESGNDAAYALGEAVSGSEQAFADLMNETVKAWGCNDTHFVNANGWKNDNHYTTARDLAVITAHCLENEELREISIAKKYTIKETNLSPARELKNYFRHVAGDPEGLTGGKTGTWDDDDCAAVASFKGQGLEEVLVLLRDTEDGRPEDIVKLMEFSHAVTPGFAVPAEGSIVETAWIRHGEKTRAALTSDKVTYAYPKDNNADEITTEVVYDKLEAPLRKGDEVGELLIYADDNLIGKHKLIMAEDVDTGWLPSYLYISNKVTKIILCVIGALIALILLLRIINKNRRRKRAALKKKYADSNAGIRQMKPSIDREDYSQKVRPQSSKEKKEARKRLREKYRNKH